MFPDNATVEGFVNEHSTTSLPALAIVTAGRTTIETVSAVDGQTVLDKVQLNLYVPAIKPLAVIVFAGVEESIAVLGPAI